MPRYTIVPHRVWRNLKNGSTASVYGAIPYTSAADAINWCVVENGYTIHDTLKGTYGAYSCPAGSSEDHAKAVATVLNNMHRMPLSMAC